MKRIFCKIFGHDWTWREFTDMDDAVVGYFWACARDCGESFFSFHE